jgi:hypothetical protein
MNTKALLGIVLMLPMVVKSVAEALGHPIPGIDEFVQIAITVAGAVGVPVLAKSEPIGKK